MIFIDTSALFALADKNDDNHKKAVAFLRAAIDQGEEFILHNYIIIESAALIHRRLGFEVLKKFLKDVNKFEAVFVNEDLHQEAVGQILQGRKRKVSLVDFVSFSFMKKNGIKSAFAFDEDFSKAGFQVL